MQQADCERRTGAHPATSRQIAVMMHLDAALDVQKAQRFAHGGVADLLDGGAGFNLAIDDAQPVLKEGRQMPTGEIAILVDGGGEDGPAMCSIPVGVVGTAAEEGNSKRCS